MMTSRWSRRAAVEQQDLGLGGPALGLRPLDQKSADGVSAPGEPPGSRVRRTLRPEASRLAASRRACVDFPDPSIPSKVMKQTARHPPMAAACPSPACHMRFHGRAEPRDGSRRG